MKPTARHDAAILGALSATVALLLGLATPSYGALVVPHAPAPAAPTPAAPRTYPAHHEGDPAPASAEPTVESPASAAEASPESRPQTPVNGQEGETIEIDGEGTFLCGGYDGYDSEDGYWADNSEWERQRFHRSNAWRASYLERRERAQRARLFDVLSPGNATAYNGAEERRFDTCSVFPRACAAPSVRAPLPAGQHVATVSRRGTSWLLSNDLATVSIDPERLCAMTLETARVGGTNPALGFSTPEPARSCRVTETGVAGGVALAITWEGRDWSQRAIVTLDDDGESPEATVSVVRTDGGRTSTFLANLSGEPMEWTIAGRTVTVPSGATARVRS